MMKKCESFRQEFDECLLDKKKVQNTINESTLKNQPLEKGTKNQSNWNVIKLQ